MTNPDSHHCFEYRRSQVCCLIGHSGQGQRSQKNLDSSGSGGRVTMDIYATSNRS